MLMNIRTVLLPTAFFLFLNSCGGGGGDPTNGIVIHEIANTSAINMSVDFSAADFDIQVEELVANSGSVNTLLIDATQAINHFQQTLDEISDSRSCSSTHSMVGFSGTFTTYAHGVKGTATIIDDCTIQITEFSYDGQGPDVFFYAAQEFDFYGSESLQLGGNINGTVYDMTTIILKVPYTKSLDDFNTLSVWCLDFGINFGDLKFSSP